MAMGNFLCLEVGEILVHSVWTGYLGSLAAMLVNVSSILDVASHWYLLVTPQIPNLPIFLPQSFLIGSPQVCSLTFGDAKSARLKPCA